MEIETPKNKKDVMRIIGLANQLKKWVPEMAFSTVHLRRLSSVNVRFVWTPDLASELKKLKEYLFDRGYNELTVDTALKMAKKILKEVALRKAIGKRNYFLFS